MRSDVQRKQQVGMAPFPVGLHVHLWPRRSRAQCCVPLGAWLQVAQDAALNGRASVQHQPRGL